MLMDDTLYHSNNRISGGRPGNFKQRKSNVKSQKRISLHWR